MLPGCTARLFTMVCFERTLESAELVPLSNPTSLLHSSEGWTKVGVDSALFLLNYSEFIKQWVSKPFFNAIQNDSLFKSISKKVFAAFSQNTDRHLSSRVREFTISARWVFLLSAVSQSGSSCAWMVTMRLPLVNSWVKYFTYHIKNKANQEAHTPSPKPAWVQTGFS